MQTKTAISGAAYCGLQADIASREGDPGAALAALFFQAACTPGARSEDEWTDLVMAARRAGVTIAEALEFGEE